MKLSNFDLEHLNYWNRCTFSLDENVYDMVILNYGSQNIELAFRFKRFKSLSFHESFLDYANTYSKSIEYLELINQLQIKAPYLMNIHHVEPELIYG